MWRLVFVLLLSIGVTPAYAQVTIDQRALEQLGGAAPKPPVHVPVRKAHRRRLFVHRPLPKPPPEVQPPEAPSPPVVAATQLPAPPPPVKAPPVPPKPMQPKTLTLIFPGDTGALSPQAAQMLQKLTATPGSVAKRYDVAAAAPGVVDDLSVARRLSLDRGLAVRAKLQEAGVPLSHIIVRALGSIPNADNRVTVTQMPCSPR